MLLLYFSLVTPVNAVVLTDNKLTVSIGNEQSWTSKNGTGNLSYCGCDRKCRCIYLTGGEIACRDGVCVTKWQNNNFSYSITENNLTSRPSTTLTILSGDRLIAKKRLHPKTFDNIAP